MTPDLLIKHFDRISEAPDAIPRLRRFILDLAVRGKLVEQDPDDEPASELLKHVAAEKSQLVRQGAIPSSKPSSQPRADELPFNLKPGWQPARFSQILVELQTGPFGSSLHQSDYEKNGTPVINPASIKNGRLVPVPGMAVGAQTIARLATFKLRENDIVMARRGEMGRCAIVSSNERGWLCGTGSLILRLPKCVFQPFIVLLIGSPLVREYLNGSAVGATMQNLNQGILLNLVIALPPLAEQYRIVAKVEELMALCDGLESAQAGRETRRNRLVLAANHHLSNGDESEEVREHAKFFLRHLPCLTLRKQHVDELRKTIRSLAIRGKLLPQHPNEEPASELLKAIQADVLLQQKRQNLKESAPLAPVLRTEVPFAVPDGWMWVRFGDLIVTSEAGWSPKTEGFQRSGDSTWGVLKVSAVSWDKFLPHENKQLFPEVIPPSRAQVRLGDFLISRANTSQLVAKCVVVDVAPKNLILSDKIVRLEITTQCSKDFLALVNNHATYARTYYAEEASGTSLSMQNVSRKAIYAVPIPLPPLVEQQRIVARVEGLMKLCDELEARIINDAEVSRELLEAVLSKALGITEVSEGRGLGVDRKTTNLCPEEGNLHERTI